MAIERWIAPFHNAGPKALAALPGMALLLAIALLLAACEYPGVPHPLTAQAGDQVAVAPSSTPAPYAPPNPDEPGKEPEPARDRVEIGLKDFVLDPDSVTVKAGTITFVLKNEGRYTHDFRVEGQGTDEKAPKVGQGRTFEWQVTLPAGTYQISCPISNHADRGMTGTLEVMP